MFMITLMTLLVVLPRCVAAAVASPGAAGKISKKFKFSKTGSTTCVENQHSNRDNAVKPTAPHRSRYHGLTTGT